MTPLTSATLGAKEGLGTVPYIASNQCRNKKKLRAAYKDLRSQKDCESETCF